MGHTSSIGQGHTIISASLTSSTKIGPALYRNYFTRAMNSKTRLRSLLLGCCVLVTLDSFRRYVNFTDDIGRKTNWRTRVYGEEDYSGHTQYKQTGNPANHIFFLKVPKAASTTAENIFLRYGDEKNLIFALPSVVPDGGSSLTSRYFYPPPKDKMYDISCTHIKYNRTQFDKVLPNDTKYIGIVREPFSHFRSCIRFLNPKSVLNIPGENPVLKYLSREEEHRNSTGRMDILCNRLAAYFGFPNELFLKPDQLQIEKYLLKLDKEMDIVLVLEFLDESVVLMRRILNWDLRHVIYGKLRVNKQEDLRLKFGSNEASLHKGCAYLDYHLYKFFVHKLKENIKQQPPDFYEELAYFRKTRIKYNNFCLSSISSDQYNTSITFEGSAWNRPFVITGEHCKKLYIHDIVYLGVLTKKQHAKSLQ